MEMPGMIAVMTDEMVAVEEKKRFGENKDERKRHPECCSWLNSHEESGYLQRFGEERREEARALGKTEAMPRSDAAAAVGGRWPTKHVWSCM